MQCQTSRDYAMQPAIRSGSNTMYSLGFAIVFVAISSINGIAAGPLVAGIAKVDITKREAGPVNDPLYVKILVLKDDDSTVVLGTVDAVAIGEIGHNVAAENFFTVQNVMRDAELIRHAPRIQNILPRTASAFFL